MTKNQKLNASVLLGVALLTPIAINLLLNANEVEAQTINIVLKDNKTEMGSLGLSTQFSDFSTIRTGIRSNGDSFSIENRQVFSSSQLAFTYVKADPTVQIAVLGQSALTQNGTPISVFKFSATPLSTTIGVDPLTLP